MKNRFEREKENNEVIILFVFIVVAYFGWRVLF